MRARTVFQVLRLESVRVSPDIINLPTSKENCAFGIGTPPYLLCNVSPIDILRDKLGRLLSMGILPNGCHRGCKLEF